MITMVICEDEKLERESIKLLINRFFSEIIQIHGEAVNGKKAVEIVRKQRPDIVLMDIQMPVMDGLTASFLIKKELPETEIIISTAYSKFEYARKAINIGVFNYLVKPGTLDEFRKIISSLILRIEKKRELDNSHRIYSRQPLIEQDRNAAGQELDYRKEKYSSMIQTICDYVEFHVAEEISLQELSSFINMSPGYMSRVFKKVTGEGLKDYIIRIKMEKARELLMGKKLIVKEVAFQTGYTDQNYFSKVFKKYYSYPPTDLYL